MGAEKYPEDLVHSTEQTTTATASYWWGVLMRFLSGDHYDDVGGVQSECWHVSLAIIGCKNMSWLLCLNAWGTVLENSLVTGKGQTTKVMGVWVQGRANLYHPQSKWSKSWCPWIWNWATKSLGVHGFGTEQPEDLVSMDLQISVFPSTNHWIGGALMSMIPHAR